MVIGHPHHWPSILMVIPIIGHPCTWPSLSLANPTHGHPHHWPSLNMMIIIIGHLYTWFSSSLDTPAHGHPYLLSLVIPRYCHPNHWPPSYSYQLSNLHPYHCNTHLCTYIVIIITGHPYTWSFLSFTPAITNTTEFYNFWISSLNNRWRFTSPISQQDNCKCSVNKQW